MRPSRDDFISQKSVCDAFQGSALQAHFAVQGIERVSIRGYTTGFCIDTNVRRAAGVMLDTVVVSDAHITRDRPRLAALKIIEHHNCVWREFGAIGLIASDSLEFAGS